MIVDSEWVMAEELRPGDMVDYDGWHQKVTWISVDIDSDFIHMCLEDAEFETHKTTYFNRYN